MNNSLLFKQAHTMTKQTIKQGDCYRIVFGQCYKLVKADYLAVKLSLHTNYFKQANKPTTAPKQTLYDIINDDNLERVVLEYKHLFITTSLFILTQIIGLIYFITLG